MDDMTLETITKFQQRAEKAVKRYHLRSIPMVCNIMDEPRIAYRWLGMEAGEFTSRKADGRMAQLVHIGKIGATLSAKRPSSESLDIFQTIVDIPPEAIVEWMTSGREPFLLRDVIKSVEANQDGSRVTVTTRAGKSLQVNLIGYPEWKLMRMSQLMDDISGETVHVPPLPSIIGIPFGGSREAPDVYRR